jgi:glycine/D-amino acid oxidase-like deaminating enzyme
LDSAITSSLWAATAPPAPATGALPAGEHHADIVVIGGGYTGLACALKLAQGGADVVLIEAREIGWGASGRNNGQVIPCLSRADPDRILAAYGTEQGEALIHLVRDSASLVFDLIREHGIQCEAVQRGWVQPAHSRARYDGIVRVRHAEWARRGAPAELLDRDATAAITGSRYWYGAWRNLSGGHINPLAYVRGLAGAALTAGARLYTQTPAAGIAPAGEGWRISTPQGGLAARRVVIATNAYSDQLWPGLARTVVPVPSYQMATEPLSKALRQTILPTDSALSDTHGDLYFCRYDGRGRLVTGGALVFDAGYEDRLKRLIGARLQTLFPQLGEVRFDYIWQGDIGMTADGLPHVHRLADGVYAWVGCNGRGVALATALGGVLADAARGVPASGLPVPFVPLAPIAAHALVKRLARLMLLVYRWRDARD